jgi:hypothetical protein
MRRPRHYSIELEGLVGEIDDVAGAEEVVISCTCQEQLDHILGCIPGGNSSA